MPQFRANYSGNYHLFVSRDDSNGHAAFVGRNDLASARIPGWIKFHADASMALVLRKYARRILEVKADALALLIDPLVVDPQPMHRDRPSALHEPRHF